MLVPTLRSFEGATFRAHPASEFVPFAALSPHELRRVAGRTSETNAAGVVRRRDLGERVLRIVDGATVELLARLKRPGPARVKRKRRPADDQIARLVLDGLLELKTPDGFACGPAAFDAVVARFDVPESDAVAHRSQAAIAHAAALDSAEAHELSARLYCYGRHPASPRWRRAMPRRDSAADFLGIRSGLPGSAAVRDAWHAKHGEGPSDGWFSWYRRGAGAVAGGPSYKLYVSPAPDQLRDALEPVVATLAEAETVSFKIGADLYGVLRTDKLVAYFSTLVALTHAASILARALTGISAHGVPFSAALTTDGMLSWGCDPPSAIPLPGRESWRLWITNRLADALLYAKLSPAPGVTPERFALARIALDGVDPHSWTPAAVAWRRAPATE